MDAPDFSTQLEEAQALAAQGQWQPAYALYEQLAEQQPARADVWERMGTLQGKMGQPLRAVELLRSALDLDPLQPIALQNLGVALHDCKRFTEAIAVYGQAIHLAPQEAPAYYLRALSFIALNQFESAIKDCAQAVALQPDFVKAIVKQAQCMQMLGLHHESMAHYDHAVSIAPHNANVHGQQSLLRLRLGDFENGLEQYEWRRQDGVPIYDLPQPQPRSIAEVQGKTLLLHDEQGLGDSIQFSRYASLFAEHGATVWLLVPRVLAPLLRTVAGVRRVFSEGDELPEFDLQLSLMSAPWLCQTRLDTIPHAVPYVQVDAERLAHWQAHLTALDDSRVQGTHQAHQAHPAQRTQSLRVGLVWTGGTQLATDGLRSLTLHAFLRALPHGARYYSLQKEVRPWDVPTLQAHGQIQHLGAELHDFAETAAACACMDVVISVDTSVAHVAAALGKPVWLLLPINPDWRWLLSRTDSPWYPSVTLFRQSKPLQWEDVLDRVGHTLYTWLLQLGVAP